MRWLRLVPALVALGIMLMMISVIFYTTRTTPVVFDTPIVVSGNGTARQETRIVAQAIRERDGQILQIPLVTPKTTSDEASIQLHVQFADDLRTFFQSKIESIQGDAGSQLVWLDDRTLQVSLIGYVADSHTTLVFSSQQSVFSLPWSIQVWSATKSLTFYTWVAVSFSTVLLAFLIASRRKTRISWAGAQPNMAVPLDLSPLEVAILHHSTLQSIDIVAVLYHLAQRGYIQILEHPDSVLFVRTGKNEGLLSYERNLLIILFPEEGRVAHLKTILETLNHELFSAVVSQLYVEVYDRFTERGYFTENPRYIHLWYKTAGILTQLSGLAVSLVAYLLLFRDVPGLVLFGLAIYVTGVLIFNLGYHIIPLTPLGWELMQELRAFRAYLCQPQPIGPEDHMGSQFYTYIPYALALHCFESWKQRFAETRWYVPDWYDAGEAALFNADSFIGHMFTSAEAISESVVTLKDPNVD